jgi:acetyl esterase
MPAQPPDTTHTVLRPGRPLFTALGYVLRVVKALPRPLQRAVLGRVAGGDLAPVPDLIRLIEASGGLPDPCPSDDELFARFPELRSVEVSEPEIAGPEAAVPARLYRRPGGAEPTAALVWVHGGAFVLGTLESAEAHWVGLALAARGIPVLSLDYRKSLHGVRAPAASDDVLAGWHWAVDHSDQLGVTTDRLHLGGASAGGNLAAGVAKRLRDGAGASPASVVLAYPLLHAELPAWQEDELAAIKETSGVFFSPDWIRDLGLHHAGDPALLTDPHIFPANGDLAGLPPTFILNCEHDTIRSSGEAYACQLTADGVDVTVQMEPGAAHATLAEPFTAEGQRGIDRIASWMSAER